MGSILFRPGPELEQAIRDSAQTQQQSLTGWLAEAAQQRLQRESLDIVALNAFIQATPDYRGALDRLGQ